MQLASIAFDQGGEIPMKYTVDGEDVSPPLAWSGVPPGTRSLALVVDDPDAPDPVAPTRTWVHWVLVDVPPELPGLPAGATNFGGGRAGVNDWRRRGWGGPNPPRGRHRYVFTLYALDRPLELDHPTKHELERAMSGHVLDQARLIGTYERRR